MARRRIKSVAACALTVAVTQRFQQARQQAGCTKAIVTGIRPRRAEQFVGNRRELLRIFSRAHAARRFEAYGFSTPISRITSIMMRALSGVAFTGTLPVEVLMKSAPALMEISDALRISASSFSSPVSMITFSSTFAAAQASLHAFTVKTNLLVTGDQRTVREYHVHFVSTVRDGRAGFSQRNLDVVIAVREVSHGCNAYIRRALLFQRLTGNGDKARVDTDGCSVPDGRFRLMAQGDDFLIGVVIIQGGQVISFNARRLLAVKSVITFSNGIAV